MKEALCTSFLIIKRSPFSALIILIGLLSFYDLLDKNQIMAIGKEVLVVGYLMKPSREEDFAKRGAFPLKPTQNGLIFVPLNYELPISSQIENIDGVLHKATDEIIAAEMSSSSDFANRVVYTKGMQELQRCTECHPNCSVIDPFNNIHSILDRLKIQQLLLGLENLNSEGHPKIRGPHFLKVLFINGIHEKKTSNL
nr:inositol 1,3,4-trisphosphate 5/6-kinase 4 isoform X2 [Ipomoea batatas]